MYIHSHTHVCVCDLFTAVPHINMISWYIETWYNETRCANDRLTVFDKTFVKSFVVITDLIIVGLNFRFRITTQPMNIRINIHMQPHLLLAILISF